MEQEEYQQTIQVMIQTFVQQVGDLTLRIKATEQERDQLKRELEFLKRLGKKGDADGT